MQGMGNGEWGLGNGETFGSRFASGAPKETSLQSRYGHRFAPFTEHGEAVLPLTRVLLFWVQYLDILSLLPGEMGKWGNGEMGN